MTKISDNIFLGIFCGLLMPTIGIIIFYYCNYSTNMLSQFIELSIKQKLFSPLLSLCCALNLGIFYLFIHFEKYASARGVILSTFIYGFAIVVLKFFM